MMKAWHILTLLEKDSRILGQISHDADVVRERRTLRGDIAEAAP